VTGEVGKEKGEDRTSRGGKYMREEDKEPREKDGRAGRRQEENGERGKGNRTRGEGSEARKAEGEDRHEGRCFGTLQDFGVMANTSIYQNVSYTRLKEY
jgi:hypothetical protein